MIDRKEMDELVGYIRPVNITRLGTHEPEIHARYRRGPGNAISVDAVSKGGSAYDPTREEVRWLRLGGMGIDEIAEQTGISREQAGTYCRQLGLPLEGSCRLTVNGIEPGKTDSNPPASEERSTSKLKKVGTARVNGRDESFGEAKESIGEPEKLDMPRITLPVEGHTGTSLRNLVFLLHSREKLINKATDAHFFIDKGLVETLKDDICTFSALNFRKVVERYEEKHGQSMDGLVVSPEGIAFTGFAAGMDENHRRACADLASAMNRMAIKQKRVQSMAKEPGNEKYSFRVWLVRIGLGGDDYKLTRKLLMENLSGHVAYRTPEDEERAKKKARRQRIRQASPRAAS